MRLQELGGEKKNRDNACRQTLFIRIKIKLLVSQNNKTRLFFTTYTAFNFIMAKKRAREADGLSGSAAGGSGDKMDEDDSMDEDVNAPKPKRLG